MSCINQVYCPRDWSLLDRDKRNQLEALNLIKVILIAGDKEHIKHEVLLDSITAIIYQKIEDVDAWHDLQTIFREIKDNKVDISKLVSQIDEVIKSFLANYIRR